MDEREIRRWYDVLKGGKGVVEVRAIQKVAGKDKVLSGYFRDVERLIEAVRPFDLTHNIYFSLNNVNEACYSKTQQDSMKGGVSSTSDADIIGRDWVLIDIDPIRPADTNASEEEIGYARQVANRVFSYLRSQGFKSPVTAFSGNGCHLLYKVAMKPTDENTDLVKRFLQVLDMLFSDDKAQVDTSVFNLSRVCKLYGTFSRKGASADTERPQRQSKITGVPDVIETNSNAYLAKIADMMPKRDAVANRYNGYSSERFDLDSFISRHGIGVASRTSFKDGVKYVLDCCPFDSTHKAPDSAIFQMSDGRIGFRCLHDHCSQKTWHDVRTLYEPDAYEHKYQPAREAIRKEERHFEPQKESADKGAIWVKMSSVTKIQFDAKDYIPSGYKQIDDLMVGFKRGHISVWSGYRGSGKSSVLSMLILNGAQGGYKSAMWSGEMDAREVKNWLYLQAAWPYNEKSQYKNYWFTPDSRISAIDRWIDKYFFLYNNEYSNEWQQMENEIRSLVAKEDVDFIILDNLIILDIDELESDDKYGRQKELMKHLVTLARELDIHIHLVAHPNKEGLFLRPNNISGTANIPDLAQNIFIIHRVNQDFMKSSAEFVRKSDREDIIASGCTNVIEICKCRDNGLAADHFVKLWYQPDCKQLTNDATVETHYDWMDEDSKIGAVRRIEEDKERYKQSHNVAPLPSYANQESRDLGAAMPSERPKDLPADPIDPSFPFPDVQQNAPF